MSCLAHVAIVLVSARKHEPPQALDLTPIELELDVAPTTSELRPSEPTAEQPAEPTALSNSAAAAAHAANAVVPTTATEPAETEASTGPVASTGTWSVSPFASKGIAILPAPNYGSLAPNTAKPQPEPMAPGQVSQSGGLKEALAQADTARGFGRGGAAVSAAHLASNEAPSSGRLVLALTFDASGAAISVQIAERSDGDPSWDNYAKAVLAHAKKKASLTLPPGARGLVVTLSIDSKVVLPSGSAPGESVGFDGMKKGSGTTDGQGHFDLSDVGSQPRKRVSARVVKESVVY